jgi:hypothetical protein
LKTWEKGFINKYEMEKIGCGIGCGSMVGYDKHSRQPELEYYAVKIENSNFFYK